MAECAGVIQFLFMTQLINQQELINRSDPMSSNNQRKQLMTQQQDTAQIYRRLGEVQRNPTGSRQALGSALLHPTYIERFVRQSGYVGQ